MSDNNICSCDKSTHKLCESCKAKRRDYYYKNKTKISAHQSKKYQIEKAVKKQNAIAKKNITSDPCSDPESIIHDSNFLNSIGLNTRNKKEMSKQHTATGKSLIYYIK